MSHAYDYYHGGQENLIVGLTGFLANIDRSAPLAIFGGH